jgi:YfiH family protein
VSEGPYASLNFSFAVGDVPERVEANFRRAAEFLGVEREHLYFLSQVHGSGVVELSSVDTHSEVLHREGDAVTSRDARIACAVRTADCVPVLVADRRSGAVAAAHAGWRGTVRGVVRATLEKLPGGLSGSADYLCAIGPHISLEAFEVSEDVALELQQAAPGEPVVRRDLGEKPHVDLRRIVRHQLTEAGVPDTGIEDVFGCTLLDPDNFFSYRRDGKVGGRHLSAIVAQE